MLCNLFLTVIGKHASSAVDLLLETVFFTWPMQSDYKEDNFADPVSWELEVHLWREDFMCAVVTVRLL
jgi:hypothetical protein